MADVLRHYDDHLGPVYEWMAGPFEAACQPNIELFDELGLVASPQSLAIDLGSGHGLQSVPLARRGYRVIAVDTCHSLLRSLDGRAANLSIETLQSSVADCWAEIPARVELVVCMGDTLTHLGSLDAVEKLIGHVAGALREDGFFVTTFRDYVSAPLSGDQRFIPVRSDENRILTCFLEYQDDFVRVHDIVHERSGSVWNLAVSSYTKIRLDPRWIADQMREHGLEIVLDRAQRGLVTIAARSRKQPSR